MTFDGVAFVRWWFSLKRIVEKGEIPLIVDYVLLHILEKEATCVVNMFYFLCDVFRW
jgi:hypothetical protein